MYFSLDQIDRGIFEALRKKAVAQGYLPDIVVANTKPLYDAALQAIRNTGKQPISIYGVGSWKAKREKKYNDIIVRRTARGLSSIGYQGEVYYEEDGAGKFRKKRTPSETAQLTYTVTIVCDDVADERVLQSIVYEALGVNKPLKGVNANGSETEKGFIIFRNAVIDQSGEDFIETIFTYTTSELFLAQDEVLETDLVALQEINFEIIP